MDKYKEFCQNTYANTIITLTIIKVIDMITIKYYGLCPGRGSIDITFTFILMSQ